MRRLAGAVVAVVALTLAPATADELRASACRVLSDPAGDVAARKATGHSDDIVAVWLDGEDPEVLAVGIEVSALGARAAARAERWALTWVNPWLDAERSQQRVVVDRSEDGVAFAAASGAASFAVEGSLEGDTIRVFVPRARMRLPHGTLLEQLQATSWLVAGEAAHVRDRSVAADWPAGPGCETPVVQPCPVVVDAAGDAVVAEQRAQLDRWLDVRAVGMAPAGELLELSLRLQAPPAVEDPRTWGYTIVWRSGGVRWFAQAEHAAEGTVFRYGRAAGRGPTLAGGARAAGRFDGRVLRIWVPRARVGAPADGEVLSGVGAWSWLLAGPRGAAAYHTVDDTASRRALAGVECRA